MDVLVERYDHDSVTRTQLIDERDRRVLDLFYPELRRRADIDHQHDRERLLDRLKIIELLLDPVLEDLKITLLQPRDKPAVTVEDRNRHSDEIGLNANY